MRSVDPNGMPGYGRLISVPRDVPEQRGPALGRHPAPQEWVLGMSYRSLTNRAANPTAPTACMTDPGIGSSSGRVRSAFLTLSCYSPRRQRTSAHQSTSDVDRRLHYGITPEEGLPVLPAHSSVGKQAPPQSAGASDELLPFTPYSETLQTVLRQRYIRDVAEWLLGENDNAVLAQAGNSVWESALTIIFLADARAIFEDHSEAPELVARIEYKSAVVGRWLLNKKTVPPGGGYACWEGVTWDTSVVIRSLLVVLNDYEKSFSASETERIKEAIVDGMKWLYSRFDKWEEQVKYPFGPADIAQIAIAIVRLARDFPDLYERSRVEHYGAKEPNDPPTKVIQYLLHKKTEKTLSVPTSSGDEDIVTYWWDDYFSTAEVVEALSRFYEYCQSTPERMAKYGGMLYGVKDALVRACTYFEQGQVEGMWGSHIDTLRVIYAYVLIRRLIPQSTAGIDDPLIVPEIHTTFKALRWMCDEKQIFDDGSFTHTMFLTTFYSMALIEVYRSWDCAQKRIDEIYDDVVWASPVRTTPERSKRLAAELLTSQLVQDLKDERQKRDQYEEALHASRRTQFKTSLTLLTGFVTLPAVLLVGNLADLSEARFRMVEPASFLQLVAVLVTVAVGVVTLVWQYDRVRQLGDGPPKRRKIERGGRTGTHPERDRSDQ